MRVSFCVEREQAFLRAPFVNIYLKLHVWRLHLNSYDKADIFPTGQNLGMLRQKVVIHPIRYDGHDICEQTNQEVLSKFNVKTSANILNCRSNLKDTKPALINTITDMVKECSYPVNGQGLANCPIALGWAELPRKLLLFLSRVRRSVFSGFSYTVLV